MAATTLLSDNGVSSGSAGYKLTGGTDGTLQLQTSTSGGTATTALTIDTSQNVGIGTSSPAQKLQVNGNISSVGGKLIANTSSTGTVNLLEFSDGGTRGAGNNWGMYWSDSAGETNAAIWASYIGGNNAAALAFGTNAGTGGGGGISSTTERMRIDSSGNLLLGITTTNGRNGIRVSNQYGGVSLDGGGGTYAQWGGQYGIYPRANVGLGLASAYAMSFEINGTVGGTATEAMRIDNSGNLLVGTTSVIDVAQISSAFNGASQVGLGLKTTYASSGSNFVRFYNSSATMQGQITANATNTVAYSTSSDYRLKENIQPMSGALETVAQLKPVTYTWKEDGASGQGFIAHELQAVVPDCVVGEKDAVDAEGNPVYQGIDTSFLVATLTAAIQELNAKVDAQAAEIAALKGAQA